MQLPSFLRRFQHAPIRATFSLGRPNFVSRSGVIEPDRYREIETCEFSSIGHVNARYEGVTETRTSHFYPTKVDGEALIRV